MIYVLKWLDRLQLRKNLFPRILPIQIFLLYYHMKLKYAKYARDKVFDVIRSCENIEQLHGAHRYYMLFLRLYKVSAKSEIAKRIQTFYNLKSLQLKFEREN